MPRHTPEEIWKQLVDEADQDEIEGAASVRVEDAERELAAAGFDVAAERAKARAFLEPLESAGGGGDETEGSDADESPPQSVGRPTEPVEAVAAVEQVAPSRVVARGNRRRQRPVVLWLAAAATATVGGGALYASLYEAPTTLVAPAVPPVTTPAPVPSAAPDRVAAASLRGQAAAACDAQQWTVCLERLDEARALDPAGDDAPSVQSTRDRATRNLPEKPTPLKPPPAP